MIEALMPNHHDFLGLHPNRWASSLVEEGELVETRLAENIPGYPWPYLVRKNPWAEQALQEVDLPTWLNLAIPREAD